MVGNGNKDEAEQVRKECVHKIGNLTLTGYNSQLSIMSLEKKQNKKNSEGKYIGFKNGLHINEAIKDVKNWKEKDIVSRTNDLVKKALEIFKLQ